MAERYSSRSELIDVRSSAPRTGLIIIIALIILIILILIIVLVIRRTSSTSSSTTGNLSQCITDVDCSGTKVCNSTTGKCVDCLTDDQCSVFTPICNTSTNTCVICVNNNDCPSNLPLCTNNICIACNDDSQCGGATPKCNQSTHKCVGCNNSTDCPVGDPICSGNNVCVQCLNNSGCIAPATCVNGQCCNLTAPTINVLSAHGCPAANTFTGTYTFSQTGPNVNAIFRVTDPTGFHLLTTAGTPATGTISITSSATGVTFYAGFQYLVSVAIIQPCGVTPFSTAVGATVPFPSSSFNGVPVIDDASATVSQITIDMSTPSNTNFGYYAAGPFILVSADSSLDPNRWHLQNAILTSTDPDNSNQSRVQGAWPIFVATGQPWYVRVVGGSSCDIPVVSMPVLITVGDPHNN